MHVCYILLWAAIILLVGSEAASPSGHAQVSTISSTQDMKPLNSAQSTSINRRYLRSVGVVVPAGDLTKVKELVPHSSDVTKIKELVPDSNDVETIKKLIATPSSKKFYAEISVNKKYYFDLFDKMRQSSGFKDAIFKLAEKPREMHKLQRFWRTTAIKKLLHHDADEITKVIPKRSS